MGKKLLRIGLDPLARTICLTLLNKFDFFLCVEGNTGCQPEGSKVLMSDGSWKNIENIKNGDEVLSPQKNGEVIFAKVNKYHQWVSENNFILTDKYGNKLYSCSSTHEIPYYEYRYDGEKKESAGYLNNLKESVLMRKNFFSTHPIKKFRGRKNCEIEPYTLGIYLGDGSFSSIRRKREGRKGCSGNWINRQLNISNSKKEIMNEVCKYYPYMKLYTGKNNSKMFRFSIYSELSKGLIKYGLEGLGSGKKFIPKEALLSDFNYRKRLLAGLIDTDGYYNGCCYEITTKSKTMSEDIKNLLLSLGQQARICKIVKKIKERNFEGEYYRISFNLINIDIPLLVKYKQRKTNRKFLRKYPNTLRAKFKKDKTRIVCGFEVDSDSHNYITDNWMVTGNCGKSTLSVHIALRVKKEFKKLYRLKPETVEYYYNRLSQSQDITIEEFIEMIMDLKKRNCYNFQMGRDLIYTQKQMLDGLSSWQRIIVPDEMVNITFNRDFQSEDQKNIIKMINMYRDHNNLIIASVPLFQTLDVQIKNLTKMKISVAKRGFGLIQTPNKIIYGRDKWDSMNNEKIERAWLVKGGRPQYTKLTTSRGLITFPPLPKKIEKRYQEIKNERRTDLVETAMGIKKELNKKPIDRIYDILVDNKIKNRDMLRGLFASNEIDENTGVEKLKRMLKKDMKNHFLKDYFWEERRKIVKID